MRSVICDSCNNVIAFGDVCNNCGNNVRDLFLSADILWHTSIKKYTDVINDVLKAIDSPELKMFFSNGERETLNKFIDFCRTPELRIALIGTIKAGKSTLINSLLGAELSPVDVNPETAAVTKFKSSAHSDYIIVHFYSSDEWDELIRSVDKSRAEQFFHEYEKSNADTEKVKWLNRSPIKRLISRENLSEQLEHWVSSKSAIHYFVKEIEVGVKAFELPEQIVIVDTPGLDDPVAFRSNITRAYVEQADAVVVCIQAGALSVPELNIINGVFSNKRFKKDKIYLVATKLDRLNDPTTEWEKLKRLWVQQLSRKAFYDSEKLAETNILGLSSYVFLLLNKHKDKILSRKEKFKLISALANLCVEYDDFSKESSNYEWVYDFTAIPDFIDKIKREIVENREKLLLDETRNKFQSCAYYIQEGLRTVVAKQSELLSLYDEDSATAKIILEEKKRELQSNRQQKEALLAVSKTFKEHAEVSLKDLFNELTKLMEDIL